ncbi:MAG: phosphatidate cytidylyltransferase [Clostridia bacterium]
MKNRVISALVALPLFFLIVYFRGDYLFAASVIVGISLLYELHRMVYKKDELIILILSIIYLSLAFLFMRLDYNFNNYLLPLYIFLILAISTVTKDKFDLTNVCIYIAFSLYIITLIPFLAMLDELGSAIVLLPFISGWAYDTAAYLSGVNFGKNRPWKNLSPKKSIEGLIGGSLASVILVLIYGYFLKLNLLYLLLYAILAVVLAQSGDLLISAVKRFTKVKDSGNILPGHGGFFDRFDSVLPIFALAYYFATNFL